MFGICLKWTMVTCFVGVKAAALGVGDLAWGGDIRSMVLFSLPKSTISVSPSRSVMADTSCVLRLSCLISWLLCCTWLWLHSWLLTSLS